MAQSKGSEGRSIFRVRWVGYGLLLLSLCDIISAFVQPQFMNPEWELQTIGTLVESVPVPLIGLVLVFFGEDYDRTDLEDIVLKVLSWLCVLLAAFYLLMVPLGILNTLRINSQNSTAVTQQVQQQVGQLEAYQAQLEQGSEQQIRELVSQLESQGITVEGSTPAELKTNLVERLSNVKQTVQNQSESALANRRTFLLKNSLKWNLGALISSVLLFIMWRSTRWARR